VAFANVALIIFRTVIMTDLVIMVKVLAMPRKTWSNSTQLTGHLISLLGNIDIWQCCQCHNILLTEKGKDISALFLQILVTPGKLSVVFGACFGF
jgi:hypothetical protein